MTTTTADRRSFLKTAGLTSAALFTGDQACALPDDTTGKPPNVLFVLADQWRFSAFSHESDPLVRTPNIDRLAEQGARFTRAYAANPVCTPNRACILTGRYAHQHGMIQNNLMLPPGERCLAESFQAAGYATHYIGKWHLDGPAKPGFVPANWRRRGFKTFEGFNRGHYYPRGAKYFTNEGKLIHSGRFESAYQTDLAIDFMKRQRKQPFFCFLSWGPPHSPYRPPEKFRRFDPEKLKWRPNVPEKLRTSRVLKRELAGYYGLCEALDLEMGRLLKAVDDMKLAGNTLVVFTSDHGDMHGSHGQFRKGKPEEESAHVPLIMRLPGRIAARRKPEVLANSIDLMPTLLSIAGVKNPGTCTGRDLSAAALGGRVPEVESLYNQGSMRSAGAARKRPKQRRKKKKAGGRFRARREWRSVVTPTHKLILAGDGQVAQLYDLAKDPFELRNLAEERGQVKLRDHLVGLAKRWARETGDPFPRKSTPAKSSYSDEEAAAARS